MFPLNPSHPKSTSNRIQITSWRSFHMTDTINSRHFHTLDMIQPSQSGFSGSLYNRIDTQILRYSIIRNSMSPVISMGHTRYCPHNIHTSQLELMHSNIRFGPILCSMHNNGKIDIGMNHRFGLFTYKYSNADTCPTAC